MKKALMAIAIAMAISANASAAIYKCSDGTYQDKPCQSATEKTIAEAEKGIPITIDFTETSSTYDIAQTNIYAVYAELAAQQWFAYNSSRQFSIRTTVAGSGQKCWIEGATIHLSNDNHLPNWLYYASADQKAQRYWDNELARAVRHENTHRQITKEFTIFLKERIAGIGVQPCATLPMLVKQEEARGWAELSERQANFDRREGGKTAKEMWANGGPKR